MGTKAAYANKYQIWVRSTPPPPNEGVAALASSDSSVRGASERMAGSTNSGRGGGDGDFGSSAHGHGAADGAKPGRELEERGGGAGGEGGAALGWRVAFDGLNLSFEFFGRNTFPGHVVDENVAD